MVVTQFGGPEVLQIQDLPEPAPREQDLLIEVRCAALNPIDFKIRRGAFREGRTLPFVPGYDVSGIVRTLPRTPHPGGRPRSSQSFQIGDEVYASPSLVRDGSNAELVSVDVRTVAPKPRSLDHAEAAALPLVTLTAWESLYERARIEAGETVLIHAGGGGVGHIAIQLAKVRGCHVLTTAGRAETIELCRSLGADVVIDYTSNDFADRVKEETDGRGCDVVFDCVGDDVFDRSIACVSVNGRMVTCVGSGSANRLGDLFVRNASLHFEFMAAPTMYGIRPEKQGEILRAAAELVDNDRLEPHVSRIFNLEELAEAHRHQETGHVTGKIAIRVTGFSHGT